jgi:hypothetical protein
MVVADGRLRRAGAAVADYWPMLNGAYGWMEVELPFAKQAPSIRLDAIRRPRDTPIWKLEGSFRCRSCGTRRYKPPVHLIKLTQEREVTPYVWVHPDDER